MSEYIPEGDWNRLRKPTGWNEAYLRREKQYVELFAMYQELEKEKELWKKAAEIYKPYYVIVLKGEKL